jgi:protein involved in polysaccharide export with SLBB domain
VAAQAATAASRPLATRAELQREAAQPGAQGDVARRRLAEGDLRPGDRFIVRVSGTLELRDTVVVRTGTYVSLGALPPIAMAGVLRAELRDSLQARVDGLVRGASVVATPLVRVGLVGEVQRPGFYQVPADVPLADVLMEAGGPTPRADLNKARASRAGLVVWPAAALRAALAAGLTLDQLAISPGDMVEIGERTTINWSLVIQTVSLIPVLLIAANSIR